MSKVHVAELDKIAKTTFSMVDYIKLITFYNAHFITLWVNKIVIINCLWTKCHVLNT